jgi:hypothetical protein
MSTKQKGKPVSSGNRLVAAIRRKDSVPTAISVAAESAIIITDGAGRMLVDHNGDFIVSRFRGII